MLSRFCASALLVAHLSKALPLLSGRQNAACPSVSGADAIYDVPCATMQQALTCPNGMKGSAGGVVLLVHGTASNGPETWQLSPYVQILPGLQPGYDVCYVTLPERSLGDAQVAAEYVAYSIQQLARKSRTGKVAVIGWSQGNLNTQWAMAYWPSARRLVSSFVSLAGDFHGTAEGPLACAALNLTQGGCAPGVIQQNVGSLYLEAQNTVANNALVPTTSLYTYYDDIIQPEVGGAPTSALPGASTIAVQQDDVCGPTHVVDHFLMTVDSAAFYLAYDALQHGVASTSRFTKQNCVFDYDGNLLQQFSTVPGVLRNALFGGVALVADNPRTRIEPPLKSYVCSGKFGRPSSCNAPQNGSTNISSIPPNIGQAVTPGAIGTAFSAFTQAITNGEAPPTTTGRAAGLPTIQQPTFATPQLPTFATPRLPTVATQPRANTLIPTAPVAPNVAVKTITR